MVEVCIHFRTIYTKMAHYQKLYYLIEIAQILLASEVRNYVKKNMIVTDGLCGLRTIPISITPREKLAILKL